MFANFFRLILLYLGCGITAIVLGSYLGAVHPLGDSLSVIRIPVAMAGLLFILIPRHGRWIFAMVSAIALTQVGVGRFTNSGPTGGYVLYQKNLWAGNETLSAVANDIRQARADFVTLQEVSTSNKSLLLNLESDFPFQYFCSRTDWSGIAVLSRHPIVKGSQNCSDWRAYAAAQFTTPNGPVTVISLHLFHPYPNWQSAQLDRILPKLAALDGPKILGGDFNMLPATRVERIVADTVDAHPIRPSHTTFHIGNILPVSIDHVIAACGTTKRRPKLGSDHHGVLARVGFSPETCRE